MVAVVLAEAGRAAGGNMKHFDKKSEEEIIGAIRRAEHQTSGRIHVHVKSVCRGDVLEEARKIFHRLGMHRTHHRNAVLVLVALKSRRFAVLGDQGIHSKVGEDFWGQVRDTMSGHFSKGQIKEGIVAGVLGVGEKLKVHFPHEKDSANGPKDMITQD